MKISHYHNSITKRTLDLAFSTIGLTLSSPLILVISILIKLTSKGPIFFTQRRIGKNGKTFRIVKFRTMRRASDKLQWKYQKLNEVDGPVFKIRNDPRFTTFGKILSKTGLDELPQFINVYKGEMSLVGPRPLPIKEARKLISEQKFRELIKPGITSSWITNGAHTLPFKEWMKLDREYVGTATLSSDIKILFKTAAIMLR